MNTRTAALLASLALIGLLAFLTISVMINDGFTPLVAVSLLILGLLGFGVVGALTTPPKERRAHGSRRWPCCWLRSRWWWRSISGP